MTPTDHVAVPLALGVATPGGAWHVAHVTLWFAPPPPTDRDSLELEAIAAYTAANLRFDAVHVWLMEDDGWQADDEDDEVTRMRERRRRDTLDAPDDVPF